MLPALPLLAGWAGSWDEVQKAAGEIRAIRAELVQEKHLPILARPLTSEGSFAFRRPGDLRWEYTRPLQSVLLSREGEIRRYVQQDGKLVPDSSAQLEAMRLVLGEIGRWLSGRFEESETFRPMLLPGPPARIELTPRDPALARFVTRIELELSPTPGVIDVVRIHEGPKSYTVIRFRKVELLPTLPDGLFQAP